MPDTQTGLKKNGQITRLAMAALWPSFLVAIIEEGFFFSLFDPQDLIAIHGHMDLSSQAVYAIGFFCFWFFSSLVAMLTYYLATEPG